MTTPPVPLTLVETVLSRAVSDWVPDVEVVDLVRRSGVRDPEVLRELSIGVIAHLIVQGLVVPGYIGETSFLPWGCTPAEGVMRIAEEWFGRVDPFSTFGEIVWLEATESGRAIGVKAREREQEQAQEPEWEGWSRHFPIEESAGLSFGKHGVENESLSPREAFLVMSDFIWRFAQRADGDLLTLIDGTGLEADRGPADVLTWEDWMDSVSRIKSGEHPRSGA